MMTMRTIGWDIYIPTPSNEKVEKKQKHHQHYDPLCTTSRHNAFDNRMREDVKRNTSPQQQHEWMRFKGEAICGWLESQERPIHSFTPSVYCRLLEYPISKDWFITPRMLLMWVLTFPGDFISLSVSRLRRLVAYPPVHLIRIMITLTLLNWIRDGI